MVLCCVALVCWHVRKAKRAASTRTFTIPSNDYSNNKQTDPQGTNAFCSRVDLTVKSLVEGIDDVLEVTLGHSGIGVDLHELFGTEVAHTLYAHNIFPVIITEYDTAAKFILGTRRNNSYHQTWDHV